LDESVQIPFVMHYEGYKYQEIAEELQLPLGTVKSRIFFARKELKEKINKRYDGLGKAWEKVSKYDNLRLENSQMN
jgi:RNA polymerase sigma-70 factor (ECF subfamily)